MNNTAIALSATLLLLSVSCPAWAEDTAGSSDHPMITRYEGSVIDGYDVQDFNSYVLPTGPAIKGEEGGRIPSEKLALEGEITRILYRGPEDRSTLEILKNYQAALESAGFDILFSCQPDNCGNLFEWLLYKDQKQIRNTKTSGSAFDVPKELRYLAARIKTDKRVVHVALMVAIDSIWTKKPVTLLEVIESKAMDIDMVTVDADAMSKGIDATGHIAVYGIFFETDSATITAESDPTLAEIGLLLESRPDLKLLVVGHTDNRGTHEYNMNLSSKRANSVVRALTELLDINPDRLDSAGVGFLAPVASNDTATGRAKNRRVELVKGK
jgi:outer membrane protein OmpA-like peptidoglycan-associated protein